jgi:hypothetical protein
MRHGRTGLAACNLGAPHQRERLFFVADADSIQHQPDPGAARGEVHEVQGACGVGHEGAWAPAFRSGPVAIKTIQGSAASILILPFFRAAP